MALVPSHQFYPRTTISTDSFQSSVSLQFFRYGSSSSFKKHKFCVTRSNSGSNSMPRRNPQTKSNFLLRKKNNKWNFACQASILESNCSLCLSSSSWLENWNESSKQNKSKRPVTVLGCRNTGNVSSSNREESSINTGGGSTMERIVEKLKKFGYVDDVDNKKEKEESVTETGSIEDIFYVEEDLLPNSRTSLSEKSQLGNESVFKTAGVVRFPWEKPALKDEQKNSVREKSRFALAELTLPESELRRLKNLALRIKNKTRVGGSGVTKEILDRIHEKWNTSEVVRLKIEGPPALNMKRMHEILERKTGGLVIWRSGTSLALYRGVSYDKPSKQKKDLVHVKNEVHSIYPAATDKTSKGLTEQGPVDGMPTPTTPQSDTLIVDKVSKIAEPLPEVKYEEEVDRLLDGLGRRYTDWSGCDPLPVDADLLPGIVPGFQPPFRILPYGVRYTLRIKEATDLRRLAKVLPPHFALGRSRQHQGLAMAMIKLWERSSIAKIALKRGVQLTASERMAEDIKRLTGGVLLSRTKDFLVFFRGKDFLTPEVANVLLEKEKLAKTFQEEEEQARLRASLFVSPSTEVMDESGTAGTLEETLDADAKWGKRLDDRDKENVMREAELVRHANLVRKLERKLAFAERKLLKAERALGKVEECLNPAERAADQDSISDEERFMFRKLGLRMKAFLLLGRRGVFGGTVENMHLHWKYRELVKIIVKSKYFEHVRKIALSLEAESGGVLVSVDRVSKGYAIVVFRGKDYNRPPDLRPKNLLTKRKALARSIELQRREALLNHVSTLQARVERIRSEVEQMATFKERGDVKLYDQLDSAYPTEDEDSEMEGEEAYLESYESDGELKSGSFDPIQNFDLETTFIDDFQDESERDDKDHNALADFNAPYPRVDEIGEEVRLQQLN